MPAHPTLPGLLDFLRIPSISALPEHAADVRRAAEFLRHTLRGVGLPNATLIEGPGHPLVYADHLQAPGKPTLLLYGHYDVQPPDPLDEWHTPPFEPSLRDGNLYARGAADDKGQVWILVQAVARLLRDAGSLPVNIRFLVEGEEESGGHHLSAFLASGDPRLQADAAVICDSEMFAPGLPSLCVGLRGIVYGEIHVRGARQDLHSGMYGGAAPNPLQAIAEILSGLKDRSGRVTIPGFYDDVRPLSPEERAAWRDLPFDEQRYLDAEIGAPALTGEESFSVLERTWARPTFEVHGIRGGFTGEGAKTVIPAAAVAKVSTRLVADQDPVRVAAALGEAVRQLCPPGLTAEFRLHHTSPASLVPPDSPFVRAAANAMSQVFARETVLIRSGGTIPVVNDLQRHLGLPSVLMGFGLPDDNIHAPNEKMNVENISRGVDALAEYFRQVGWQRLRRP